MNYYATLNVIYSIYLTHLMKKGVVVALKIQNDLTDSYMKRKCAIFKHEKWTSFVLQKKWNFVPFQTTQDTFSNSVRSERRMDFVSTSTKNIMPMGDRKYLFVSTVLLEVNFSVQNQNKKWILRTFWEKRMNFLCPMSTAKIKLLCLYRKETNVTGCPYKVIEALSV